MGKHVARRARFVPTPEVNFVCPECGFDDDVVPEIRETSGYFTVIVFEKVICPACGYVSEREFELEYIEATDARIVSESSDHTVGGVS